jgi:hypothetical protein
MEVMRAVPGNEISGLYLRIYDKNIIQQIIDCRRSRNILHLTRSGVRPGKDGPVLSRVLPKLRNARFVFLNFSRQVDFSQLRVERISGVRKRP